MEPIFVILMAIKFVFVILVREFFLTLEKSGLSDLCLCHLF